jgi:Glyoxalase-like domain
MGLEMQVTFDCADPARLAGFWAEALGYRLQDPPEGFDTWPAALAAWGVPESEWNSASALVDPEAKGPRIYFQRVPEPKAAKNRMHLDLRVSDGPGIPVELKRSQIQPTVDKLVGLGAVVIGEVEDMGSVWTVMQDPEGNEFCIT